MLVAVKKQSAKAKGSQEGRVLGSVWVALSIPQTKSNVLLLCAASCVSSQATSWGFVVFKPAALLTNTSAFCLAHSYFTLFPEL